MMEDVEKGRERIVAGMELALAGILGEVLGHRAVRAKQAEVIDKEPRDGRCRRAAQGFDGGGREGERGILSKANRVLSQRKGVADARLAGEAGLQKAHRLKKIKLEGPLLQFLD